MNVACALNIISNKKLTLNSFIKFCYLRVGQVTLVVLWRQERLVHERNHENSFRHFQFYVKSTGTRKSLGRSKSCTNSSAIDWAFLMQMPSTTCRFRRKNYSFDRYELRLLPTTFRKKVEQRQVQSWTDSNAKMADTRHLFRWLFNLIEKLKN